MDFLKSGWSYLSNSFTQNEEGENESNSVDVTDTKEPGDPGKENSDNEANEFVDAVDIESHDLAIGTAMGDSHHHSLEASTQRGCVNGVVNGQQSVEQSHTGTIESKSSDSVTDGEYVDQGLIGGNTVNGEEGKLQGYTTLDDSDSDDIVSRLPPPSKPVGSRQDTESQLNQIINNLGDDLAVLEIDHGHLGEESMNGEDTFGETLYLTAYDKTVCAEQDLTLTLHDSTPHLNGSLSNSNLKTTSKKPDERRPPTPLFHDEYLDSGCNTPTNQSSNSISFNDSVASVKNRHETPWLSSQNQGTTNNNKVEDPSSITKNFGDNKISTDIDSEKSNSLNQLKHLPTVHPIMDDPVDEIPISRGSYTLDFDNLDSFNPFQTSKGIQNSPDLPSKSLPLLPKTNLPETEHEPAEMNNHIVENGTIANSTAVDDLSLANENNIPESSETNSNYSTNISEKDTDAIVDLKNTEKSTVQDGDEEAIPVSHGAYTVNFDNLDSFDPFTTSKGLMNSPTKTGISDPFNSIKDVPTTPPRSPVKNAAPFKNLGNNEVSNSVSETKSVEENSPDPETSNNLIIPEFGDMENVDPKPKKLAKKPVLGANRKKLTKPKSLKKKLPHVNAPMPQPEDREEDIIIPKGSYSINFDDLDSINPFKTSKGLSNSPTKAVQEPSFDEVQIKGRQDIIRDEVLTDQPDISSKVPSDIKPDIATVAPAIMLPEQNDDPEQSIPPPKGSYSLDLENLNDLDPFKTSPAREKSSEIDFNKLDSAEPDSVLQTANASPISSKTVDNTKVAVVKKKVKKSPKKPTWNEPDTKPTDEDDVPIAKGSYNLDFDNLDAMDPFKTGKGLSNSPTEDKTLHYSVDLDNVDPFKPSKAMANSPPPSSPMKQDSKALGTVEAESGNKDDSVTATKPTTKSPPKNVKKKSGLAKRTTKKPLKKPPPVDIPNEEDEIPVAKGSYNLDFDNLNSRDPFKSNKGLANSPTQKNPSGYSIDLENLDNVDPFKSTKAISNSPPTSPTKMDIAPPKQEDTEVVKDERPPETKKPQKKELARKKLTKPSLKEVAEDEHSDPPVSRGSYNLDLDNLDSMDPFKSTKGMASSPTKMKPQEYSMAPENVIKLPHDVGNSPSKQDIFVDAKVTPCMKEDSWIKELEAELLSDDNVDGHGNIVSGSTVDKKVDKMRLDSQEKQALSERRLQQVEFEKINENEEFYPASNVFQDSASLNFLDKLADTENFNECKLRKQSLYVKFDPLVSASPTAQIEKQLEKDAAALREIREVDELAGGDYKKERIVKEKHPKQRTSPDVSVDMDHHSKTDSYGQAKLSRESTSFRHTQIDFEAALRQAEQKWQKEREEHERKAKSFQAELDQMIKVVGEYDRLFAEMANNGSRNGMLTREQQLLTAEHEQTLEDMAALERSHEDLCRRYNRLKTVVAQFKQNEEILKESTNQMVQEAKEAEKKYVTLKTETDETVRKANEELHSVKANAQQEVARAQAQLKLFELKCESLQNQVRECSKENNELTKLCDDLIACSKQDA